MRRPGYRFSDTFPRDWSIYDAYDEAVSRLWENNLPTGEGEHSFQGAQLGDSCVVNGNRGTLRLINGELVCVPDGQVRGRDAATLQRDHAQTMADVYAEYDQSLAEAYRTPR